MNKCTIIIPTYNRPEFLKRAVNFYYNHAQDCDIVVADSSDEDTKASNKQTLVCLLGERVQYFDEYSVSVNLANKLACVLLKINTPYAIICADDDLVVPAGVKRSLEVLELNPGVSVCHGHYIKFSLDQNRKFSWAESYPPVSNMFRSPKQRLYHHLSFYRLPTFYGVHRTDLLRLIFDEAAQFTDDCRFAELLPTMITLIYGKMRCIDTLYCARNMDLNANYRLTLDGYKRKGSYAKKYNNFRDRLVLHLVKSSNISSLKAAKLIDQAMGNYHNIKHLMLSSALMKVVILFQGGGFMNLLQYILMNVVKKLRVDLNRADEASSSYYCDFNLIRSCVIEFGKNNYVV